MLMPCVTVFTGLLTFIFPFYDLSNMSARILAIGDTHIPDRADRIPESVEKFVKEGYDILAFTGDLTAKSVLVKLTEMSKASRVYAVRGNMDSLPLPIRETFEVSGVRFGLLHGHGVYPRGDRKQLENIGIEMGVDVLITGHTHCHDVYSGKVIILNPGSATGVWGGGNASLIPSAMSVEVVSRKLKVELCLDGELEVYELDLFVK